MKLRIFFFGTLMIMLFLSGSNQVMAQEDHAGTEGCETPTQFISITADPDADGSILFDKTELTVDKDTCVELTFYNKSPAVEHDFTVDANAEIGIAEIYVLIMNNTDGHEGADFKKVTFQTPDVDETVEFYCSVAGHLELGMFGDLVIGGGDGIPGFELSIAFVAMFALIAIPQLRKRS